MLEIRSGRRSNGWSVTAGSRVRRNPGDRWTRILYAFDGTIRYPLFPRPPSAHRYANPSSRRALVDEQRDASPRLSGPRLDGRTSLVLGDRGQISLVVTNNRYAGSNSPQLPGLRSNRARMDMR